MGNELFSKKPFCQEKALVVYKKLIKGNSHEKQKKYSVSYITGCLMGIYLPFMIDSGSNYCLINKTLVDYLNSKKKTIKILDKKCNIVLSCGINCKITPIGLTKLQIQFGNSVFIQEFIIVENLSIPCIIGLNFLLYSHSYIDFQQSCIYFPNGDMAEIYGIYLNMPKNSISDVNMLHPPR